MRHYIADLLTTIDEVTGELWTVDPERAARHPAAGRWSVKEIIGHLIDSASNNHQRFVRARWQDDLVFAGYDQDRWVEAQGYQTASWDHLLRLWSDYNRHIARVMASTPAAVLFREHARHNLHEIAWRPVPVTTTATLDYLMSDYVGHLHHHVGEIRERLRGAAAAGGAPAIEGG